jgi:hypothetical protein
MAERAAGWPREQGGIVTGGSMVGRGRIALVLGVLAAAAVVTGPRPAASQPEAYSAAPIRGRVVDAETQQPLAGVHVVAQWILNTGMFLHAERIQRLQILETVTDAKGEYEIPGWGPKPRPPLSRLETADPRLTFFKPGYRPLDRSNNDPHDRPLRTSRWDGKTIPLDPFRGTPDDLVFDLLAVQLRLHWGLPEHESSIRPNDYWRHFPRIVLTVLEQRAILPDNLKHRVRDLSNWGVTEEELRSLVKQRGDSRQ